MWVLEEMDSSGQEYDLDKRAQAGCMLYLRFYKKLRSCGGKQTLRLDLILEMRTPEGSR